MLKQVKLKHLTPLPLLLLLACGNEQEEPLEPNKRIEQVDSPALGMATYWPTSDLFTSTSKGWPVQGSGAWATRVNAESACGSSSDGSILIGKVTGNYPPVSMGDSVIPSTGLAYTGNVSLSSMSGGLGLKAFHVWPCFRRESSAYSTNSFKLGVQWNSGPISEFTYTSGASWAEYGSAFVIPINAQHIASDTLKIYLSGVGQGVSLVNWVRAVPNEWETPAVPGNLTAEIKNAGVNQESIVSFSHDGFETLAYQLEATNVQDASSGWATLAGSPLMVVSGEYNYFLSDADAPTQENSYRNYRVRAVGPSYMSAWSNPFQLRGLPKPANAYPSSCTPLPNVTVRCIYFTDLSTQETGYNLYRNGSLYQNCSFSPGTGSTYCICGSNVDCPSGNYEVRTERNNEESGSATCSIP